ncbi:MAG: hypothetical protein COZ70_06620 [Deltaproteobacteria bacterium CG_4_8_14_3_um_filter_51_11]|nr:hypothetical protein [bacterium]NCP08366.1 hypothetical protein [bacterium]PIX19870.1 MAG: hypothetical protein COZ70_06620 [Deltaproteobacteria bacterium CG_4_8_14_3_um_filter_51_11]
MTIHLQLNRILKAGIGFLFAMFIFYPSPASAGNWHMSLYAGQWDDAALGRVLAGKFNLREAYIGAFALGREIWRSSKGAASLELEAQLVGNWGREIYEDPDPSSGDPGWDWAPGMSHSSQNSGSHFHWETNLALVGRWHKFPWNRYLQTSLSLGDGISYAAKLPPYEVDPHGQLHGEEHAQVHTARVLNYLLIELSVTRPEIAPWSVFFRIHHRSGIFGLIDNVDLGSDFVCLGVRYDFSLDAF